MRYYKSNEINILKIYHVPLKLCKKLQKKKLKHLFRLILLSLQDFYFHLMCKLRYRLFLIFALKIFALF